MNATLLDSPSTIFAPDHGSELAALVRELRQEVADLRREVIDLRQQVGYWRTMHARAVERGEKLQREIDLENAVTMLLSPERFPTSCRQAYERLCVEDGMSATEEIATSAALLASSVFTVRAPLVEGVDDVLRELRERGWPLVLLTQGDDEVQQRRIDHSGLREHFGHVEIVATKSTESLRLLMDQMSIDPDDSWLIGNSLRSDVWPAIEAGLNVAWIPADVWAREHHPEVPASPRFHEVRCLADLPDLIGGQQ